MAEHAMYFADDKARRAYSNHFYQADNQRHENTRNRIENKRADRQDHILWFIRQKTTDVRNSQKEIRRHRKSGQHTHNRKRFYPAALFCCHKNNLPKIFKGCIGKKPRCQSNGAITHDKAASTADARLLSSGL